MRWLVVSLLAELQVAFITYSLMAIPNDLCDFVGKDFSDVWLFFFRLHVGVVKGTLVICGSAIVSVIVSTLIVVATSYTHERRSRRGVLRIEVLRDFSGFISHRGEDYFLHFLRGAFKP